MAMSLLARSTIWVTSALWSGGRERGRGREGGREEGEGGREEGEGGREEGEGGREEGREGGRRGREGGRRGREGGRERGREEWGEGGGEGGREGGRGEGEREGGRERQRREGEKEEGRTQVCHEKLCEKGRSYNKQHRTVKAKIHQLSQGQLMQLAHVQQSPAEVLGRMGAGGVTEHLLPVSGPHGGAAEPIDHQQRGLNVTDILDHGQPDVPWL